MPYSPTTPIDSRVEMFQRGQTKDAFFNMKALAPRPLSDATMFDTDFEDDESEIEDNSPRLSVNSIGRRSETTLSSFEEVHTPSPSEVHGFHFDERPRPNKAVEGPRGPHLFRTSVDSSIEIESDDEQPYNLTMSPMTVISPLTPRPSSLQRTAMETPRVPEIPIKHRHLSSLTDAVGDLNLNEVATWTPKQVAKWMIDAGFEPSIVEKFRENDISGAILITLKFEDLRELDIQSFGQRTKVWNEIHILRGSAPATPKPPTPIDETASPCVEFRPQAEFRRQKERSTSRGCGSGEEQKERRRKNSRRRHKKQHDVITPLESVSIVGIEQLMPKPHKCAKGENCSKWRKQQRLIENFKKDHPVSPEGGQIWIAGDPGNPLTAPAVLDALRPVSDAVPSVVASSDVLGPGPVPAFRHLEEASLRNVQSRDPQENVKQFIRFQHMDPSDTPWSSEEPPTPPYEMFPALQPPNPNHPHSGLRGLPKLAIPPPRPVGFVPPPRSASANAFSPYRMERCEALSPELRNNPDTRAAAAAAALSPNTAVYRFGTPFSEVDIPVTAIPLGPVQRDFSQSVPPNMAFRHTPTTATPPVVPARTQSRTSARRPSVPIMPRVDENASTAPATQTDFHSHQIQPPTQSYPWSPVNESPQRAADDISHAGWMKKRKTRLLRHEWQEHHFTLQGTRLAMHKDDRSLEALEYIDVDDYAIACSSLASNSKINAAFKAMNISRGDKSKKDEAAFAFQLIPATMDKGARLKKRESSLAANEGKDAKNRTHYFAVKSRDERIDWMRELMLAKALKQKSEGYEINVNGNMI